MKLESILLSIFMVLVVLMAVKTCKNNSTRDYYLDLPQTDSGRTVRVKYDSIIKPLAKVDTLIIRDSFFVATNLKVDTAEVIRRFLTSYFYRDTFSNHELNLVIQDSLKFNQISNRQIWYKIIRPDSIITNTITITKPVIKPVIYAGLGIGAGFNSMFLIPKVSYSTPKGYLFEGGFLIQNNTPAIYAGINFKIK